jgi:serine/threonine-protein kinase
MGLCTELECEKFACIESFAMPEVVALERAHARVGTTIAGKYRLDRLLGVGGMASVYAATHRNNKRVAVKVLHAELSIHADLRQRFMREGYVANTLDHSGAVAVLDDDVTEDGSAFLVMELLVGATLAEVAEHLGGRLPLRAVLAAADQVLDVLAAADAHNIVHRDIKPANLFLTTSGVVKVLDFGVARMRDVQGQHTTHTGVALGTPAFMAPEQAIGRTEDVGGRTDLWALGATIFALLTGRAVHEASSGQQQMVYAATRSAESLATIDPAVPAPVVAMVDKALAFHPHARWDHAAVMRRALRDTYRAIFEEDPFPAVLAPLVSYVRGERGVSSGAVASSPLAQTANPMAPTFPATPVDSGGQVRPAPRESSGSGRTAAVSVAGSVSQSRGSLASRARMVAAGTILVVSGALLGAWAMGRGMRTTPVPVAASTGVTGAGPTGASQAPPFPSALTALAPATSGAARAGSSSPGPSASAAASASVSGAARPAAASPVRTRSGAQVDVGSSRSRTPPPDEFDHQ